MAATKKTDAKTGEPNTPSESLSDIGQRVQGIALELAAMARTLQNLRDLVEVQLQTDYLETALFSVQFDIGRDGPTGFNKYFCASDGVHIAKRGNTVHITTQDGRAWQYPWDQVLSAIPA